MRRRDRFAEVYFYEWSINRWRTSETRTQLSMAGRGIYRELLDLCYAQGSISKDFRVLAAQVGCDPVELEQIWPLIRRHFYTDKHDPERLKNHASDQYRKHFFGYIEGQKQKGRLGGLQNVPVISDIGSSGLSAGVSLVEASIVEPSIVESSIRESPPPNAAETISRTEAEKQEVVRVTLQKYPGVNLLPAGPDITIICLCLTAVRGDLDAFAVAMTEIYRTGKKPSTSWAWFPKLLANYANGKRR